MGARKYAAVAAALVVFFAAVHSAPKASSQEPLDYSPYQRVLARYVDWEGFVDYAGLKRSRRDLDRFIGQLKKVSPASHSELFATRESRLAYWINAYNAWILRIVVDHYPVTNITKIGAAPHAAFIEPLIRLGGEKMSLQHLENEIIRRGFNDPWIHFALNCASLSCPRLPQEIFHPDRLDAQLEAVAHEFNNQERHVRLERANNRLVLSRIYQWYEGDFLTWGEHHFKRRIELVDYILPYLRPELRRALAQRKNLRIVFSDYDWSLNDQATGSNGNHAVMISRGAGSRSG